MRKRLVLSAASLGAALLIVSVVGSSYERASAQTPQIVPVQRKDIQASSVQSTGQVVANQTAALSFGLSGKVSKVSVQIGDTVKAGQPLAALDTTDLDLQVSQAQQDLAAQQAAYNTFTAPATDKEITQARAALAAAQTQLTTAQTAQSTSADTVTQACANVASTKQSAQMAQDDYDNYVKSGYLADATFIPDPDADVSMKLRTAQSAYSTAQSTCDTAKMNAANNSTVTSAQAAVTQAQAALDALTNGHTKDEIAQQQALLQQKQLALDTAKQALSKATLVAPFDGTITAVGVTVGEQVGGQNGSQNMMITLVDLSKLYFDVNVDEADINQLSVGQTLTVSLDSISKQTFNGQITKLVPTGQLVSGVVTYTVRVDLGQSLAGVMPGMKGHIASSQGAQSVLVVPTAAIQHDANGTFVYVVNNNTPPPVRTTVGTGQVIGDETVIVSGLTEGQSVAVPPGAQS